MQKVIESKAIEKILNKLAHEIIEDIDDFSDLVVIGIINGGRELAFRVSQIISKTQGIDIPLGYLDITAYRDDLFRGNLKTVSGSEIVFDINDKNVLLIDDVIFSGRTIRAALDSLNDFGRPQSIKLGVLVDRGNRDLPISANYTGKHISTTKKSLVTVHLSQKQAEDVIRITG